MHDIFNNKSNANSNINRVKQILNTAAVVIVVNTVSRCQFLFNF